MLHFLVLAAKSSAGPLPPELVEVARDQRSRLKPVPGGHTHWTSSTGSVHVAGWHDGEGPEPWRHTADGLVAHAGEALDLRGGPRTGRTLVEAISAEGLTALLPSLEGVYALVRASPDGAAEVVTDAWGIHTLYEGETPTARVFANDAHLVARCLAATSGREPVPDTGALAMVVAFGSICGDRTSYQGVQALPFGTGVRIEAGTAQVRTIPSRPVPWSADPVSHLTDEMVDATLDRMGRLMAAVIERHPEEPLAELTAGKDSRLVLAVARHAGLLDQITFFTRGGDTPDFLGAWALARRLDLSFVRARWPVPPAGWEGPYREHVARVAGQVGAWESSEARDLRGATFSGLLGEILRASVAPLVRSNDRRVVLDRFERIVRQRAGPLRPEVLDQTVEELKTMFAAPLDEGYEAAVLADIFYIRHHQRRLFGAQVDRHVGYFYPLYVQGVSETAFALGPQARLDDRLRRALMERAAPDLGDLEFAKVDRTRHPPTITETPPELRPVDLTRSGVMPRQKSGKDITRAEALRQITRACADSPAFEIIDRTELEGLVDGYESRSRLEHIKAHKAIAPILWLDQLGS